MRGPTGVNAEAISRRSSAVIVLWTCIALFFARVVGQIEVLLLEPDWLPTLPAWYSGLLPYPILLPVQIALLMVMCMLAIRTSSDRAATPVIAKTCRVLAMVYFTAMAARLLLCIYMYGRDYYLHGAIPVAFHWVLALFVLVWARNRTGRSTERTSPAYPMREPDRSAWSLRISCATAA